MEVRSHHDRIRALLTVLALFLAGLLGGCSTSPREEEEESSSSDITAVSSGSPQEQLGRIILGATFMGIDGALAAYDVGELDFLLRTFEVIGNLPHDKRMETFVEQGDDLWFPIFCAKLVQLRRQLGNGDAEATPSRCLAKIQDFERKVGELARVVEGDFQRALRLVPGATFAEKLRNVRTFYENFGGRNSSVDDKVDTAITVARLVQTYQTSTSSGADPRLPKLVAALAKNRRTVLGVSKALSRHDGYIDGASYAAFYEQLDTTDLRLVLTKLLPELGLTQALSEGLLRVYDDHTQEVNGAVFGAVYPKGAAPYAELLRQLGVERPAPPVTSNARGAPGGAIKPSQLIALWNEVWNGNSATPYRDLAQLITTAARTGAATPAAKSPSFRTGVLAHFAFPRGLPARKLATALEEQVLPLDLVVSQRGTTTLVFE